MLVPAVMLLVAEAVTLPPVNPVGNVKLYVVGCGVVPFEYVTEI